MQFGKQIARWAKIGVLAVLAASVAAVLIYFPWDLDPQRDDSAKTREFYQRAYATQVASKPRTSGEAFAPLSAKDQFYVDHGRKNATEEGIPEKIDNFVAKFGLRDKKVLEVGAGSGQLQDAVADYTGLDISTTAGRFFHKPYVEASATEMPFTDNTFDAMWTIWVLEHIPNPEKALMEIRRVVKPGGYLYLYPAYRVSRYAAQGYRVRPYRDFDLKGKLIKASAVVADSRAMHYLQEHQIRLLRAIGSSIGSGPSHFHFNKLTPNYDDFWESDSDGAVSFTPFEVYLWFKTRGDTCVNCPPESTMIFRDPYLDGMVIQVNKAPAPAAGG